MCSYLSHTILPRLAATIHAGGKAANKKGREREKKGDDQRDREEKRREILATGGCEWCGGEGFFLFPLFSSSFLSSFLSLPISLAPLPSFWKSSCIADMRDLFMCCRLRKLYWGVFFCCVTPLFTFVFVMYLL